MPDWLVLAFGLLIAAVFYGGVFIGLPILAWRCWKRLNDRPRLTPEEIEASWPLRF